MSNKRSFCQTCAKSHANKEVMSVAEALLHADINVDHHVIVNPDAEEIKPEDSFK